MNSTSIRLHTGASMPILGLGTWKSPKDKVGQAVEYALLECGYTHIDCAAVYRNEEEIGQSFKNIFESGKIKREDIFVTSKLWNVAHARQDVLPACKKSLKDLQLDYLDLYLMHWGIAEKWPDGNASQHGDGTVDESGRLITPKISVRETWEAMEELVASGLVRAIGVANFTGQMIVDLLSYAKIKPAVNQIELHPYNQQNHLVTFCQKQGIAVTAYSPLGTPANAKAEGSDVILLEDPKIQAIAKNHGKTTAQILIRWAIERGTIVIPKSVTPENIRSNMDVVDFKLSPEEMASIATMDRRYRFVNPWEWWGIPYFD